MHKYLRALGFSKFRTKKDINELITYVVKNAEEKQYVSKGENEIFAEYSKRFGKNFNLTVRGEYDDNDRFLYSYYFPTAQGNIISSYEDISIERHAEKESYAGVCDDFRMGVSIIFYLQNVIPYLKIKNEGLLPIKGTSLMLTALSIRGKVVMPLNKNEADIKKIKQARNDRNQLLAAARKGDEDAIESLTLDDMDTYTVISKKILKEDLFSLVDTYFMPYGVECDHYSIMGEIIDYRKTKNEHTEEELYEMTLNCNDLVFNLYINKQDIYGEPEIGRRFKGIIWLQGFINFPE